MSKPVATMAALKLVEQHKLSLDADINTILKSWKLPSNDFTTKTPVTLRMLLSHTSSVRDHDDQYAIPLGGDVKLTPRVDFAHIFYVSMLNWQSDNHGF